MGLDTAISILCRCGEAGSYRREGAGTASSAARLAMTFKFRLRVRFAKAIQSNELRRSFLFGDREVGLTVEDDKDRVRFRRTVSSRPLSLKL
jgi:hypothetical protein